MINSLTIENFKCFSHLKLYLGKLSLLTGFNGGGKSTAIQPLLLLSQGAEKGAVLNTYALNGPLVRLGTVADVLPAGADTASIEFTLAGAEFERSWNFTTRAGERHLRADGVSGEGNASDVFPREGTERELTRLVYISAVREGTADAYPIPNIDNDRYGDVGIDGRFAAYWYDRIVDDEVPRERLHPDEPATSVRKQLDAWMSSLFPGAQANVQALPQVSLMNLQFRLSDIGPWQRPANVGYGLTYAFPIVVALLAARDRQIVVIDSPEAHLHPSAQSQMGRILAHFAAAGVQIVVETHSDHLLNGTRLAVRDGQLRPDDLRIHFFTGASAADHGLISPAIDAEGRINEWPAGFFDQGEKDISVLAGWA